jgi:small-conductance mechanosensitive channel
VYDRVHRALLDALDQAGIEMPFTTYDLNLKMSPEQVARLSQAFGESGK